mmetsp:Transcript_22118/g.37388  ORF Transcript_22118/g.37388 Transcript_22118/m.37388 type:complete len:222 (+) Transcript_22118:564-1229(+)
MACSKWCWPWVWFLVCFAVELDAAFADNAACVDQRKRFRGLHSVGRETNQVSKIQQESLCFILECIPLNALASFGFTRNSHAPATAPPSLPKPSTAASSLSTIRPLVGVRRATSLSEGYVAPSLSATAKGLVPAAGGEECGDVCVICLNRLPLAEEDESLPSSSFSSAAACAASTPTELRKLPCGHVFHRRCVDRWLLPIHECRCGVGNYAGGKATCIPVV